MKHQKRQKPQHTSGQTFRRFEFVLRNDSARDQQISGFLDSLPRGQAAEFIRAAVWAAMSAQQPDQYPPEPVQLALPEPAQPQSMDTSASAAFNRLLSELAEIRRDLAGQQQAPIQAATPVMVEAHASPPGPAPANSSAGSIDTTRERRKLTRAAPTSAQPPAPANTPTAADMDAARLEMLRSIRSFGQKGST